ncbi:cell division protein FtsA [Myxococcota bacterium]|nr:cell division protein FtsA [Myxococcota bacterium]
MRREIIAVADIGSGEVKIVIAEMMAGELKVLGCGRARCEGIVAGRVSSITNTAEAVRQACQDAQAMSGCELSEVMVCFGGRYIGSMNNTGSVYHRRLAPASVSDVNTAIENATHVKIEEGAEIVNVIPRGFSLDDADGIQDPVRMTCMNIEADVNLILSSKVILDNIQRAVERASLRVREFVAAPYASSLAVLDDEEKRMGVLLLNMGAGTTSLQVWRGGALEWTGVVDNGGNMVTTAINRSLKTPFDIAEKTKLQFGSAICDGIDQSEWIEVPTVGGRQPCRVSRLSLAEVIIGPTVREWLGGVADFAAQNVDFNDLHSGIVITGGAARMRGMVELTDEIFNLPTRLGQPHDVSGLQSIVEGDPSMSAAWGTILFRALSTNSKNRSPMAPRSLREPAGKGFSFGSLLRSAMGLSW